MTWTVIVSHLFFMFLVIEIATIAISFLVATYKTKYALIASFKYNLLVVMAMLFAVMGAVFIFAKMTTVNPGADAHPPARDGEAGDAAARVARADRRGVLRLRVRHQGRPDAVPFVAARCALRGPGSHFGPALRARHHDRPVRICADRRPVLAALRIGRDAGVGARLRVHCRRHPAGHRAGRSQAPAGLLVDQPDRLRVRRHRARHVHGHRTAACSMR